jgi:hypothetical protein
VVPMRCTARTKAGKRCKANAMKGKKTCLFHSKKKSRKKYRRKKPDYSDMTPMTYRYRGGRRVR